MEPEPEPELEVEREGRPGGLEPDVPGASPQTGAAGETRVGKARACVAGARGRRRGCPDPKEGEI